MKATKLIKPAGIGLAAIGATYYLAPKYIEIAAVGAGLLILYKLATSDDKTPSATNVKVDGKEGKITVTIKNPSKKTHAFISKIMLKQIQEKALEGNMMQGSSQPDRFTLLGETPSPSIIGPNETITVTTDMLIPTELYESLNGTIQISLDFKDVPTSITKSAEHKIETSIKACEEKLEKIETKEPIKELPIETPLDAMFEEESEPEPEIKIKEEKIDIDPMFMEEDEPEIENTIKPETMCLEELKDDDIPLESFKDCLTIPEPPKEIIMDTIETDIATPVLTPAPDDETIIQIVPENLNKADEIIASFKDEDLEIKPPKDIRDFDIIPVGKSIGQSRSMLKIISALDRLNKLNATDDAI